MGRIGKQSSCTLDGRSAAWYHVLMRSHPVPCSAETLFEFPCSFPLKVIGENADDFESLVAGIARRHAPGSAEWAVCSRPSKAGKYLAVTVTFTAESKEQLDALYRELYDHERVLIVF